MLDSSFFHNSTNSLPAEICFFPLHDCTCARAWKDPDNVGMLDKKAPEQNIIYQSTKNILFWYKKNLRKSKMQDEIYF